LYNYKARFYSTTLGRFVSADSIVPEVSGDGLNRFAYVVNNPIRWNDPTGHDHGCHEGETPPCAERAPVTGGHDAQDRARCFQDFVACATFAFSLKYGVSDTGFVIVMGWWQSNTDPGSGDVGNFWNFIRTFLGSTNNCAGRVSLCEAGFYELLDLAGADAVYEVFGVKLIESDPNGWGVGGIVGNRGYNELHEVLANPRKDLVGVMGYSWGAGTVANYYANHPDTRVAFWLNEGAGVDWAFRTYAHDARRHRYFAGEFHWNGGGQTAHIPHNASAVWVIGALAVKTRQ
jgi:hypothetical protein